jgi:hypothetical protein
MTKKIDASFKETTKRLLFSFGIIFLPPEFIAEPFSISNMHGDVLPLLDTVVYFCKSAVYK